MTDREARPVTLPPMPTPDSTVYGPNRTVRGHAVLTDKVRSYATAAVLADRASQSARIAALEAALQEFITEFDAFCKVHWTSGASQDVRRWPWDAARAVLAGETLQTRDCP